MIGTICVSIFTIIYLRYVLRVERFSRVMILLSNAPRSQNAKVSSSSAVPAYSLRLDHYGPGPVVVWYFDGSKVRCSVRGNGALQIAKSWGGGGHELAAGCSLELGTFVKWLEVPDLQLNDYCRHLDAFVPCDKDRQEI